MASTDQFWRRKQKSEVKKLLILRPSFLMSDALCKGGGAQHTAVAAGQGQNRFSIFLDLNLMLVLTQTRQCYLVAGQQYSYQTPPSNRPRRGQQLPRPLPSPSPALPPSSSSSPGIPISSHYFSPTSPPTSQYKTEEDSGFESLVTTNSDSGSSTSHQVHLGFSFKILGS